MKLNPVILIIVVALAVYIGLNIDNKQTTDVAVDTKTTPTTNEISKKQSVEQNSPKSQEISKSSGLEPKYLMDYLSENGFKILPVFKGKTYDIYSGKLSLSDSKIVVQVDVYQERSSGDILLIEMNIDASSYIGHPNQKEVENLVNKIAINYFVPFVQIPYEGSKPKEAGEWVKSHILSSYDDEPKEKTSTKIGLATINIFGDPLFRTLEIDFGFARPEGWDVN